MEHDTILLPARYRWALVAGAWGGYILVFFGIHTFTGTVAVSLSIFPVVVTAWYFGILGSLLAFLPAVILNAVLLMTRLGYTPRAALLSQGVLLGNVILFIVAFVAGYVSVQTQKFKQEIHRRKTLEEEHETSANFLAILNDIVSAALATDNLKEMLHMLAKRVNELLNTDSSYICLWDDERELTIPVEACGLNRGEALELSFAPGEKTLTASVLETKSAIVVEDLSTSTYFNPAKNKELYKGSMLGLPLVAGDRKLGSILLSLNDPHHFTQDEITRGEMAARHISLALDKSLLLENAQRNLEELAIVNRIVTNLSASLDLQNNLQRIADELLSFLSALHVGIALLNNEKSGLVLAADATSSQDDREYIGMSIPINGNPATEKVLTEHRPLFIDDAQYNPLTAPVREHMVSRGTQSLHLFPLLAGDHVIGTIGIGFSLPSRDLDKREKQLIETVLLQASSAIQTAHLFEASQQQAKQQAALFKLSTRLATALDEKNIARQIIGSLCQTLGYDYLGFYLVDKKSGDRVLLSSAGWSNNPEIARIPSGRGLTERPLLDGQLHYTPEVRKDPLYVPGLASGSEVDVPVWIDGKVEGILAAEKKEPFAFEQRDFDVLSAVANLAGLALTRTRLFEATKQQARQQAALFQLSNELATHLDEEAICWKVVDALHDALGFTHVGLFLVDQSTDERVLVAGTSKVDEDFEVRIPPGLGLSERPLHDNKLHYTPDVRNVTGYVPAAGGSEVDVPIRIGEAVGGVLVAENKQPYAFDESNFDLLSAVANLTGLALTRSRLSSAERRQFDELATLHAVALAITKATDEDKLLERVTQIIGESLYPDNFGILLVDESVGALRAHPSYSIQKEFLGAGKTVPFGQGVVGRVLETGLPERIPDVTLSPYYRAVDSRTRSELAVPLRVAQRVIGVINAESTKLNAFSDADERILITIAGHLAMAVNRLRATVIEHQWTKKLTRSNALIAALGQVAARIGSAPDIEGVMQTLGHELRNLNLTCLVALYTPPGNPELTIRYTSLSQRIVHLFERASGYKLGEFRIAAENLSAYIDLTKNPRPVILTDSIGAAAQILGGFSRSKIAKVLQSADLSEDVQIGHFPLVIDKKVQGLLWLWGESLHEDDLPAMSVFANQVAIAIENARLFGEVQRLASIDELTGLHNRRHFQSIAQNEFSRGLRYKRCLSAMMLDIDHFKAFNDTYGHAIGDQVLQVVANRCKQILRKTDVIGRYGGEEFVILLPETSLEIAKAVAERLRKSVSEASIPTQKGDLNVTVSIGVAENNEMTPTLETLVARADQAMYVAKHKGRNQVATSI